MGSIIGKLNDLFEEHGSDEAVLKFLETSGNEKVSRETEGSLGNVKSIDFTSSEYNLFHHTGNTLNQGRVSLIRKGSEMIDSYGWEAVKMERKTQVNKHNYSLEFDKKNNANGQLSQAAKYCLTLNPDHYPGSWDVGFGQKFAKKPLLDRVIYAGALYLAEYERTNDTNFLLDANVCADFINLMIKKH